MLSGLLADGLGTGSVMISWYVWRTACDWVTQPQKTATWRNYTV